MITRAGFVSVAMVLAAVAGCRGAAATARPVSETTVLSAPLGDGGPDLVDLARAIRPVVVSITAVDAVRVPDPAGGGSSLASKRYRTFRREAEGAGFILDAEGHVATVAHLVSTASAIRVTLADERTASARVVGCDPTLDVAVLLVEGLSGLPAATLGSSDDLQLGEAVVAVGSPFGFAHTVTAGIVSAKRRVPAGPLEELIQTDAPMNPGSSGGPLFNRRGEVIGINTIVATRGAGVGFSVPIDAFREMLPQLLRGHVVRADLGVQFQRIDEPLARALRLPDAAGALVTVVAAEGPGRRAGLQQGDVIVKFEGARVRDAHELELAVARKAPGSRVVLGALRNGKPIEVSALLVELDEQDHRLVPPVAPKPVGWGVDLMVDRGGVLVRDVAVGSVVEGRLETGDLIIEVDRASVTSPADVEQRWSAPGPHLLRIERDGEPRYVGVMR